MKHLIVCSRCHGSGKESLSRVMERTLAAVPKKNFASTADVIKKLNDPFINEPTAINNRLSVLLEAGLVQNEKRGRRLFWKRVA